MMNLNCKMVLILFLESPSPEIMKLFGSTKKLIDKTKTGENEPSLEVIEVVLVQCNLVDNQ